MKAFVLGIVGLAALTVTEGLAFGASVAAKKDGVEVLSEAAKGASVLATLKKGDTVDAVERKGMYWQVKTSAGATGFVSVMNVAHKTSEEDKSLSKAIRDAAKDGRGDDDSVVATRTRSAVMGVRGLDESADTSAVGNVKPNLRMVYGMEDRVVNPKSLEDLGNKVTAEIEKKMGDSAP
jgi:uncharacterized protein YgiM (DUF1202 family)